MSTGIAVGGRYKMNSAIILWIVRRALGISFFVDLFYLAGHYIWGWDFPTPVVLAQILITVTLGLIIGAIFAKIWPIPRQKGFERVIRTLLISIPAVGLGFGVNFILQGLVLTHALWMIFAVSAWLGSGIFMRTVEQEREEQERRAAEKAAREARRRKK